MNEDKKGKTKVLFPDDIETITISINDYDRLYGDLTYQNIELQQENARLKDKIEKVIDYANSDEFEQLFESCANFNEANCNINHIFKEN